VPDDSRRIRQRADEKRRPFTNKPSPGFESAQSESAEEIPARFITVWGKALVDLGKLEKDSGMFQQALPHLLAAVASASKEPSPHFNLACAYALLDKPDDALGQLRLCLEMTATPVRKTCRARSRPEIAARKC